MGHPEACNKCGAQKISEDLFPDVSAALMCWALETEALFLPLRM